MTSTNYILHKGVNRAIEFRGLKAQYIWWLAGGLAGLLILFAGLYIAGLNPFICIGLITLAGILLFREVYRISRHYGQYGLMKKAAAKNLPDRICTRTRKPFLYGKRTH